MAEVDIEMLKRAKQLTPEEIAAAFHDAYEEFAPDFGYVTRRETAVPWAEVPEANRALMIAVIRAVIFEGLHWPDIIAALVPAPAGEESGG